MKRLKLESVSGGYCVKGERVDLLDFLEQSEEDHKSERVYTYEEVLRIAKRMNLTVYTSQTDKHLAALRVMANREIEHSVMEGYYKLDFDLTQPSRFEVLFDHWMNYKQWLDFCWYWEIESIKQLRWSWPKSILKRAMSHDQR